jgi:6-pyruvoyltetrahydropterin/6-carboxytetrahydropterin synthase
MYAVDKKLKTCSAAHRLLKGYQGKCRHLHGHNYAISIRLQGPTLDADGLLIDFALISQACNDFIQRHWDHATLVSRDDTDLLNFVQQHQQKHAVIEGDNTSAEVLARTLFTQFEQILAKHTQAPRGLSLYSVTVNETESASATYIKEAKPCL